MTKQERWTEEAGRVIGTAYNTDEPARLDPPTDCESVDDWISWLSIVMREASEWGVELGVGEPLEVDVIPCERDQEPPERYPEPARLPRTAFERAEGRN